MCYVVFGNYPLKAYGDYLENGIDNNWTYYKGGDFPSLQAGDMIRYWEKETVWDSEQQKYVEKYKVQHAVMIYSVSGGKVTVIDCNHSSNANGKCIIDMHELTSSKMQTIKNYYSKGTAYVCRNKQTTSGGSTNTNTPTINVYTNGATNITATSAQLNGSLSANSNVHITEHGAYLGTSTSNMTRVAKDTVNYNRSSLVMFYNTTKYGTTLQPNTTYYYYQYAVINSQTVKGTVVSFKTPPDPSISTTPPATPSIRANKTAFQEGEDVLISWPSVDGATSYEVTYIQSQDFVSVENTLTVTTNQTALTQLGEGAYQIYVVAKGPDGTSGKSNTLTLTVTRPQSTTPEPITPPAPPVISISATSIAEGQTAILSWADVPDSTEYDVQISSTLSGSLLFDPFAKSPYTISDLEAGVYKITVTAYGPGGTSGKSNTLTLTVTQPQSSTPDPISPPAPPAISISATSITESGTATLFWADVPNSTEYEVQIEDVSSAWGSVMISPFAKSPYTVSDLEAGVYQIYVCESRVENQGNEGSSNATKDMKKEARK